MRYCPDCGTGHECEAQGASPVDREVEIARINAKRDIEVARITANMQRDELETAETIAETQAGADVAAAVAEAEIIGAAVEAGMIPDEEPAPVIIDAPEQIEETDDAPPVVEQREESGSKQRKSAGIGFW